MLQMRQYTSILPHQRALGPAQSLLPFLYPHTPSLLSGHPHTVSPSPPHSDTRPPAPPAGSHITPTSAWACPLPGHPPVPTLSLWLRRRTGNRPKARFGVRPGSEGRGQWGGTGLGDEIRPRPGPQERLRREAAWGSAGSSLAASKSGRATAKSPTFLEPLESHFSGGGWGVLFK